LTSTSHLHSAADEVRDPNRPVVILDACVLINLLASGRAEAILSDDQYRFAVCSIVKRESVSLRSVDSAAPPEEVILDPFCESGCLDVLEPSGGEEETLYVDYAVQVDDGEAMSLALAHSRGLLLATDDRKARRLFLEELGDAARLLTTAAILKAWAKKSRVAGQDLRGVLVRVTQRGRFFPPADDPDYDWWSDAVR
jgi:hypothetical protein